MPDQAPIDTDDDTDDDIPLLVDDESGDECQVRPDFTCFASLLTVALHHQVLDSR